MTALERLIKTVSDRIPSSVTPSTRIEIHPSEWLALVDELPKAALTSKDVTQRLIEALNLALKHVRCDRDCGSSSYRDGIRSCGCGKAQDSRLLFSLFTDDDWKLIRAGQSPAETNGVDPNYKLPCDVRLPLAMSISKGCPLSTLMNAFRFREGWSEEDTHFQDERAKAVRRSITELLSDRDRLNAEMAGRVLGDPRESVEIGGKGPTIWQNADSSEKSNEQPSAPAVVRPTLSEPPSLGSAAGVDLTISRPPQ